MGIFDSIKGALGLDKSGGSQDAFQAYQKFIDSIAPQIEKRLGEVEDEGANPFIKSLLGLNREAVDQADRLPGLLRSSTLASPRASVSDAARAARASAGGRGLAFGSGLLASRAATESADRRGGLLANALLQGEQQRTQLLGFRQQGAAQSAGLEERHRDRLDRFRLLDIQGRFGLGQAALGGGLQGDQASAGRRTGLLETIIG